MVSVVVPAYNARESIGECLEALLAQSLPREQYEVIVVDDGSTDGTVEVTSRYPVRVLSQPHSGPGVARNLGARMAKGKVVLFTDADCAPARDWIEMMVAALAEAEVVGVKGTYRTRQRGLIPRFVQLEYEDKYDHLCRDRYIDFVDTYSAGYRRHTFLENGGFDSSLLKLEDQELSFRLAERGYKMVFAPQAVVYHRHPSSLGQYLRRKFRIGYEKVLIHRWHPQKVVRDSHTPPSLRFQVALLPLFALAFLASPFWTALLRPGAGLLVLFFLSVLPFTVKALRRDWPVGALAPLLLLLRAAALGAGFATGLLRPPRAERRAGIGGLSRGLKRGMDLLGASLLLLISLPLLPLIALWIKLDSPGPVFFVQERAGENGRPFRMYKFRSMVKNAPQLLPEMVNLAELAQPAFKVAEDPRVTRAGRFLRRASLDEIPQLWNVLKGEMSLVGPRPEEMMVVQQYNAHQRKRLIVKPGITGPMQVDGRADLPFDKRLELELAYIENYSLLKDLCILLRTVPAVLSRRGAY